MAEDEEGADGGGEPDRPEPEADVGGTWVLVVGEVVERFLDRGPQFLERGPVVRPRVEAGVDLRGQLARQVGAQAVQRAGAAADRAGGGGRVAAPVRVLAAPSLVQGEGERVDVGLGAGLSTFGLLR
jgi:hypothetical protein